MKIRYHHLLCLPRFKGEGYSSSFCENMLSVKNRFDTEEIELVDTCDDVCAECPNNIDGVCKDEEKVKQYDNAVKHCIENNQTPHPIDICSDCKWFYICKNI